MPRRIAIIGGGITGLAAVHRLIELQQAADRPLEVILFEASPRLGGIIKTENRDGFLIEAGPDSFISEKPEALNLAKRIGLESQLIQTNPEFRRSFIVRNGRLRPVPEGFQLLGPSRLWPFIKSDIFSWAGKARMTLDLVLPRRIINGNDDETLASFVRRRLGREALERMAQPMVGGIYTADPERLSLRATMPRFLEMERKHGSVIRALMHGEESKHGSSQTSSNSSPTTGTSGARYSLFLSLDRGMQMLVDRLSDAIAPSVRLYLKTGVEHLELRNTEDGKQEWLIRTNNNQAISADGVCIALPGHVTARLVRNFEVSLATELERIIYASTATINLGYRRDSISHSLDGFGFVVPFVERRSLIACTFSSVKFAGRAPDGDVLLRAFVGGAMQPELFELDEKEIIERVKADLRDLLGVTSQPLFAEVNKWNGSMPQYHLGHLELVDRIVERTRIHSGLALAGNAYSGAGIPDCIRSGETAAESLWHQLTSANSLA